jgi:drug/metabolite transporter (DMT)-like permease
LEAAFLLNEYILMIYLLLSVLASTAIMVVFKLFDRFKVNTFPAIVVNYWVAALFSFQFNATPIGFVDFATTSWFLFSILLGGCFIGLFYLFGLSTRLVGASITTVAAKMSLVMPVCFAMLFYNDSLNFLKIAGIILALVSVYLITKPQESGFEIPKTLLLPAFVFIFTGFTDTFINYIQRYKLGNTGMESFTGWVFLTAALVGTSVVLIKYLQSRTTISLKSVIAGIILGIPNYFSLLFLLKALAIEGLESSVLIPVNNMSIVALTALVGISIFKEKLSSVNLIGLACCFGACAMILVSGFFK